MNNITNKNEHLIALEWLRFFLGLYIIVFHTFHYADQPSWVREIFGFGFFATSTFFILSGFLLSHVYLKNHGTEFVYLKESPRSFIVKRFSNLYPIHIFSMLLYVAIIIAIPYFGVNKEDSELSIRLVSFNATNGIPKEELKHYMSNFELFIGFLMNILMVQSWNPYYMTFNFPTWSISTLFLFYIIFPFVVLKINKVKNIYLFILILNFIYISITTLIIRYTDLGMPESGILHRNPIIRLPEFLSGIALCVLYHRNKIDKKEPTIFKMFFILIILIIGFVSAKMFLSFLSNELNSGNIGYHLLHNGLIMTLEMTLIYFFLFIPFTKNKEIISISKKFGSATLPMFALHIPLFYIFIRVQKSLNNGVENYNYYVLFLFLTIYFCILFQEKFVNNIKNKIQNSILK